MLSYFIITKKDINNILFESFRFSTHLFFLTLLYSLIDGKHGITSKTFLKSVLFTIISVIFYNIFLFKIYKYYIKVDIKKDEK
jgi:hypothetical protein